MFKYGSMLLSRDGIQYNINEAIKYLKMAADKGNIESMYKYGRWQMNNIFLVYLLHCSCDTKNDFDSLLPLFLDLMSITIIFIDV